MVEKYIKTYQHLRGCFYFYTPLCVNKVYFFVNDMFNFEGKEYLGEWDLNERTSKPVLTVPYTMTHLFNGDFREFQRHGYGRSFPVLSRLHELEDFQPQCIRYPLVK